MDAMGQLAKQQPAEEEHEVTQVQLSSGRHFVLSSPKDLTDTELLEICGWVGVALKAHVTPNRSSIIKVRSGVAPERRT